MALRNVSSLTQALNTNNPGNNRKRAFSTPHITPAFAQQMLANSAAAAAAAACNELPQVLLMPSSFGGSNEPNVYFYNKTASGRSSFCVDESLWPTAAGQMPRFINVADNGNQPPILQQLGSDTNIYTNLALGNERYKLPVEFTTSLSPGVSITTTTSTQREGDDDDDISDLINENDEDLEESADQFSPLLYPTSQPIAISAGNSPVHKPKGLSTSLTSGQRSPKRAPSPHHHHHPSHHQLAYSASPSTGAITIPYGNFYNNSTENIHQLTAAQNQQHQQQMSYSYDPGFAASMHRLPLPPQAQQQQQNQQPPVKKQLPRQPPPPTQRHSQPSGGTQFTSPIQMATHKLSTASIESAPGAIIFATSPTSSTTFSQNRSVKERPLKKLLKKTRSSRTLLVVKNTTLVHRLVNIL